MWQIFLFLWQNFHIFVAKFGISNGNFPRCQFHLSFNNRTRHTRTHPISPLKLRNSCWTVCSKCICKNSLGTATASNFKNRGCQFRTWLLSRLFVKVLSNAASEYNLWNDSFLCCLRGKRQSKKLAS